MNSRHIVVCLGVVLTLMASGAPSGARPTTAEGATAEKIQTKLLQRLQKKDGAAFWVRFESTANLSGASQGATWEDRGRAVYDALTRTAEASQAEVRVLLDAARVEYTPFWASNAIYVSQGSLKIARLVAAKSEVSEILAPTTYRLPKPTKGDRQHKVDALEWNISAINADDVWSQFGDTGSGIVVANIDTGAQYTHPALVEQYRGNQVDSFDHNYNWYDPSQVCPSPEPCDNHGHGTHTMGTMVGDDRSGNQIGVAPGARWIAAKGCETSNCSQLALVQSGQWMLAPTDLTGQNPRHDLRPHIVNNSWGEPNGSVEDPFYDDVLTAWRAAGIFPAFSNGNEGPGCDTAGSPGDSLDSYSVGAYDINGAIGSFSSRGPGANNEIKPNISAPGVAVRSSVPNNSYSVFNGTSMAVPHVAATVALMWSAAPALVGDVGATESLLDQSAVDAPDLRCGGTVVDNHVFGEGRLNAHAAVEASPRGPTGTLEGTLTDADTGDPIEGGLVTAVLGGNSRSARSGEDGAYTMRAPPGDYNITAKALGYEDGATTGTVEIDQTTTIDFALDAHPAHMLQGEVAEQGTGKTVAGVTLTLAGTPLTTITDTNGHYRFGAVPADDYTVIVTPARTDACFEGTEREISIQQDTVENFQLGHVRDVYGYNCTYEPAEYIEADNVVTIGDPDERIPIELPFAFDFYQRSYRTAYVGKNFSLQFSETGDFSSVANVTEIVAKPFLTSVLTLGESGQVATRTAGAAPNRTFTLEWRDVQKQGRTDFSVDFQVTLHENGEIVFAYRDIDPEVPGETGTSASAGIEGPLIAANPGEFWLMFNDNSGSFSNTRQVRFTLPPHGVVTGTVTDANDGGPVGNVPIIITDTDGNRVLRHLLTNSNGQYRARLMIGEYDIAAVAPGYKTRTTKVNISPDQRLYDVDANLATGVFKTSTDNLGIIVDGQGDGQATMTLTNHGNTDLSWRAAELAGQPTVGQPGERLGGFTTGEFIAAGVATAPDGNLWATGVDLPEGPAAVKIREFRPDGTQTGTVYDPLARWGLSLGTFLYDPTYVRSAGWMCSIASPFDNPERGTIYCFDPADGNLRQTIELGQLAHRANGLAYDEENDVFYVTGDQSHYTGGVTTVSGLSHANPGTTLSGCAVDFQAGGAGYNSTSHTLWVSGDGDPYTQPRAMDNGYRVSQIDPTTCTPIREFRHDGNWALGVESDATGNLRLATGSLFGCCFDGISRYGSGDPAQADAAWLSLSESEGILGPGESTIITVSADLVPGEDDNPRATLRFMGNAGRDWDVRIPVSVEELPDENQPPTDVSIEGFSQPFVKQKSVRVELSADDPDGIDFFEVNSRLARFDDGFGAPKSRRSTSNHLRVNVPAGRTACFSATATDTLGAASEASPEECTAVPVNNKSLEHSKGWEKKQARGHFLNSFSKATKKGATLRLERVRARRLALVATKCKGCGTVKVLSGEDVLKKVKLNSNGTRKLQLINVARFGKVRRGTIKIVVTSKGKLVKIEGLGISRM